MKEEGKLIVKLTRMIVLLSVLVMLLCIIMVSSVFLTQAPPPDVSDATPIDRIVNDAIQDTAVVNGKKLFRSNCASCHRADEQHLIGPGLHGVIDRVPSREWLYDWVKNSAVMIESGDAYANKIYGKYGTPMNQFDFMTNEQIDDILSYVEYYNK